MRQRALRTCLLLIGMIFAAELAHSFEHIKGIKKLKKLAKLGLVAKVLAPTVIPIPLLIERKGRGRGGHRYGGGRGGYGGGGYGDDFGGAMPYGGHGGGWW